MKGDTPMGNKILAAALILVIVLAAVFVVNKLRSGNVSTKGLEKAVGQKMDFMNAATRDKVTMTLKEYQALKPDPQTSYRIGSNGELLTTIHSCMACGAQIPAAPMPAGVDQMREDQAKMKYDCPLCKKKAYPQDL
jgi:hypothetical protein